MTLDEAIERYTNNAEYERTHGSLQGCLEFRQLVEWLKELKKNKDMLDKIRAEIEELDGKYVIGDYATYGEHSPKYVQLMEVLQIIDRCRNEVKP